ncbi:hypothetical protein N7462_010256 [Penicillium macrosclerotiorum]|uniref:uncharacterized protein n=1 Tax=Penicillium macrosclerotiorum TaxID=303699 RepID=UPI0025489F30|nr:uncharacterized protein N7462_010256 [Penicillium macrosclerotiorum]KAJ5669186.1 hypothetical protein N7462_010256 [Penicillium macrosclerotiorum]
MPEEAWRSFYHLSNRGWTRPATKIRSRLKIAVSWNTWALVPEDLGRDRPGAGLYRDSPKLQWAHWELTREASHSVQWKDDR